MLAPAPTALALDIRAMARRDWPAVAAIFEEGIAGGNATFELEAPTYAEWNARHLQAHRFVATSGNTLVGWAALSPYSDRGCYWGVAEDSVYVASSAQGRGAGRVLLSAVVESAERAGIWTLQAGIFPENVASLRLHHRFGFRTVGLRERLGRIGGEWRDVLLLERRSKAL